jgi:hypothetical protein
MYPDRLRVTSGSKRERDFFWPLRQESSKAQRQEIAGAAAARETASTKNRAFVVEGAAWSDPEFCPGRRRGIKRSL